MLANCTLDECPHCDGDLGANRMEPQPIETAPQMQTVLIFLTGHEVWTTGYYVCDGGSNARSSNWWSSVLGRFVIPSHWCPLPPSPRPPVVRRQPVEIVPGVFV